MIIFISFFSFQGDALPLISAKPKFYSKSAGVFIFNPMEQFLQLTPYRFIITEKHFVNSVPIASPGLRVSNVGALTVICYDRVSLISCFIVWVFSLYLFFSVGHLRYISKLFSRFLSLGQVYALSFLLQTTYKEQGENMKFQERVMGLVEYHKTCF